MFRRRWIWFGRLVADEGFSLAYGNKSITYRDQRGLFEFGLEDGFLFAPPRQISGNYIDLDPASIAAMVKRVIQGIESEGKTVQVYPKSVEATHPNIEA